MWLAGTIAVFMALASAWHGTPHAAGAEEGGPRAACPEEMPAAGFADVVGNPHERAVDCVVWYGLAKGVGPRTYAPRQPVRRDQMATFVTRAMERLAAP